MNRAYALLVCFLALSPALASAQNLLANADFDLAAGMSGWAVSAGTWQVGADAAGDGTSGSAAGTSTDGQLIGIYSQQCIPVDPVATPTLLLGALFETSGEVYARVYLGYFSDADCGTPAGFSDFVFAEGPASWTALADQVVLPDGTAAVQVWADFNPKLGSVPPFTGSYDSFYLGPDPLVFADGFEAGGTAAWSVTAGGG